MLGNGRGGILSCNRDARRVCICARSLEQLRDDQEDLLLGRSTLEERPGDADEEQLTVGVGLDLGHRQWREPYINVHFNELEGTRTRA